MTEIDTYAIKLCKQIVRQPGFGYDITPAQYEMIGYTIQTDPDWPSYEGIVRQACAVLREAGFDPSTPKGLETRTLPGGEK